MASTNWSVGHLSLVVKCRMTECLNSGLFAFTSGCLIVMEDLSTATQKHLVGMYKFDGMLCVLIKSVYQIFVASHPQTFLLFLHQ